MVLVRKSQGFSRDQRQRKPAKVKFVPSDTSDCFPENVLMLHRYPAWMNLNFKGGGTCFFRHECIFGDQAVSFPAKVRCGRDGGGGAEVLAQSLPTPLSTFVFNSSAPWGDFTKIETSVALGFE